MLGLRDAVPLARSRAERFDDLVLDAVDRVEQRVPEGLEGVEFAVEDVPPVGPEPVFDGDVLTDGDVPLSRVLPAEGERRVPRVVLYRRPVEARATDPADLGDLVVDIVVEQVARLLGVDPDDLDPPH